MLKQKTRQWEVKNSSLQKHSTTPVTYEECRDYACSDIARNFSQLTPTSEITELQYGSDFHFLVRVSTCGSYNVDEYYKAFEDRSFISFSTLSRNNISRYKDATLFAYNVSADSIVHMFPVDSNIKTTANIEYELTDLPSLWLTLNELETLAHSFGVYSQITCKTKDVQNNILKPFAVICLSKPKDTDIAIANSFKLPIIIVHPDVDAVNYCQELYYDYKKTSEVSKQLENLYGITILKHYASK